MVDDRRELDKLVSRLALNSEEAGGATIPVFRCRLDPDVALIYGKHGGAR